MSRSGYVDDCDIDQWDMIRWRGAVQSAIKGKRGQAFLRELLDAMDGMDEKVLIAGDLEKDGDVCAIGAVGKARGLDMATVDPECPEQVAKLFGIAQALACEIQYLNDDWSYSEKPEARFKRMRSWVARHIKTEAS